MKVNNLKKVKSKIDNFYYDKLSLKNEDNSFFDITPLIETNLGYFPITGIYKTENDEATRIKTKNYYLDTIKNDHTLLNVNEEQPIWDNIKDLKTGDKIMTISGEEEIISIEDIKTNGNFFDFRVDPTHSYFTNGILSHNSMIALSMMRDPSIDLIVYMDSEGGGVTTDFADFLGIDTSKILYTPVETVEDLIKRMQKVIDIIEKNKSSKNVLMVIDSISMVSTEKEKDPSGGADMGAKAKLTRQFFRTYARKMQRLNIAVVMTAHLTQTIGGYGPSQTVAGGTVMGYMPSIEVRFSKVNADSEMEKSAIGTSMSKIRAEIKKSRFGTHGKRVRFDLSMSTGLDEYAGLGDILKDYEFMIPGSADLDAQIVEKKIPKKSSGWWMMKPWDNPDTTALFNKMKTEGLTSSGKFREKQIKDFCKQHEWFKNAIADLLSSIYKRDLLLDGQKNELVEEVKTELVSDNKVSGEDKAPATPNKKTTKKAGDVKVTKVTKTKK